jgi:hypothetical protein
MRNTQWSEREHNWRLELTVASALAEIFAAPPPRSAGEWIGVAPPKPEADKVRKSRARFTPGKPLTTNPPHPLIRSVDDELVLRGMA